MTELKPCPFCGGEADTWDGAGPWHVVCTKCGTVGSPCLTEAEAIEAWNSRAERTCECVAEYAKSPIDGKTIVLHRCSACRNLMRPHMDYCPNCGARVLRNTLKYSETDAREVGE